MKMKILKIVGIVIWILYGVVVIVCYLAASVVTVAVTILMAAISGTISWISIGIEVAFPLFSSDKSRKWVDTLDDEALYWYMASFGGVLLSCILIYQLVRVFAERTTMENYLSKK